MRHAKFRLSQLIGIISILLLPDAKSSQLNDPFYHEIQPTCEQLHHHLLEQLQAWQVKGITTSPKDHFQTLWLVSKLDFITVSQNQSPPELQPWQIKSITEKYIIWQAPLPDDCHDSLVWQMPIHLDK